MIPLLNYKSATLADFLHVVGRHRNLKLWKVLLSKAHKKLYASKIPPESISYLSSVERSLFLDALTNIEIEDAIVRAKMENIR